MRWMILALCLLSLSSAHAQTFSITLRGGAKRLAFPRTRLTANGLTVTAAVVPTLEVNATGQGGPWSINLQVSNFTSGANTITAQNLTFQAVGGSIVHVSGQNIGAGGPRETGSGPQGLSTSMDCVTCAIGFGNGVYQWTPNSTLMVLAVPDNAAAGTYAATLTATLLAQP
ncbi:MAG: hypothetical protein ACYCW6_16915 [Candidatus Xenobia bacterium]